MKPALAKAAAGFLAEAWQMGMTLRELPPECRPRNAAEAYRIQDLLAAELDMPIGGWKIGCTSRAARRIMNARGPFAGRVLGTRIFASGATLPAAGYRMRGLEGEFAFRLARDLPRRARRYRRTEVRDAIAALYPAIEVIDSRFTDWLNVNLPSVIADQGGNGALVLGAPVKGWRRLDLTKQAARMIVNGKVVGAGTGADCMGDPLAALVWLANLMRRRGGLAAGQVISTGTCTSFHRAGPSDSAVADFGRMGKVALKFSP